MRAVVSNAVQGTIDVPGGSDIPSSVSVTIETTSIDTHEPDRDTHLRSPDFLDAQSYGQITFRGAGAEGSGSDFVLRGDLTIHGVTKPVELKATFEGRGSDPWGNARIGYEARGSISRKDFGLGWNQALETGGVLVGDDVKLEISVEAIGQK